MYNWVHKKLGEVSQSYSRSVWERVKAFFQNNSRGTLRQQGSRIMRKLPLKMLSAKMSILYSVCNDIQL